MASLKDIETTIILDILNYPEPGATTPVVGNGPVVKKIVFGKPLNQVKSLTIVGYQIFEPYQKQATALPFAFNPAEFQRDPYFIVNLDGMTVESSTVINGVSVQGAVLMVENQGYFNPVSFMQPRGIGTPLQDAGTLNEINVRISRPQLRLQTPINNTGPATITSETAQSPLFNRLVLKLLVHRYGDQPIQAREGLPPAMLRDLPDTFYSDDRQIAIQERYNAQRY